MDNERIDHALPLTRHRLTFAATASGRWPRYPGSAWRGAFGHALKRTVCIMRLRPCPGCPLQQSCVYPTLFETAPGEQAVKMRRYDRVPHPYVLQPSVAAVAGLEAGDRVRLDVTLIGSAAGHIAYVVKALQDAGARGIGPDRLALDLVSVAPVPVQGEPHVAEPDILPPGLVAQAKPVTPPPSPDRVRVEICTPLRLQREGQLVGPANFTPGDLLRNLVRRVSMLRTFFTGQPLDADFAALKALSLAAAGTQSDLRWLDLVRRSSRQDTVMRMGGIVGRFDLDLEQAEPLWPFLWLGQWIGAGKGATMGLGQFRVRLASE